MADDMYGHVTLITGPEQFLAEREMARSVARARALRPEAAVTNSSAGDLVPAHLEQMTGADLFSSATIACVTGAEKVPKDVEASLKQIVHHVPDNTALIISHAGGNQGKALLQVLTSAATTVIPCPAIKPWELAAFVTQEVRSHGKSIGTAAAQGLVDSVGQDTRSLAAAVTQLISDTDTDTISLAIVNRYFAGRATVTAFAVSDDALAGRVGEAIFKLRWALSTGVAHVLVTSALANSLRQIGLYLAISVHRQPTAAEISVPPWKLKDVAASANSWSPRAVAGAIRAVSQADAQIKGAAQDPDFALERLIIRLAALRRSSQETRRP
ncbi:MAG: DNA polymerase III subunit delta [Propionibacteriaceae bacterium]|nr:DNA polymerase III subunit delta [Propionibacteriaceae bacterium]